MNLIESIYAKVTGWDLNPWTTPDGRRFRQAWQADDHMDTLDPGGKVDGVQHDPRVTNFKIGAMVANTTEGFRWQEGYVTAKLQDNLYRVQISGDSVPRTLEGVNLTLLDDKNSSLFERMLGR